MKSISWKQSILIVLFLHGFVYVSISQYSNYKKEKAKKLKESRESLYANKKSNPEEWPKITGKPIIAKPIVKVNTEPVKDKQPIIVNTDSIKKFISDISSQFSSAFPVQQLHVNKPSHKNNQSTIKSQSVLKPQTVSTKSYTKISKPVEPQVQYHKKPDSIPVRRAIPVPQSQNSSQVTEYVHDGQTYRETNQITQRVIRTYVVVQ
jgi:hypothetical protein